MRHIIPLVVLIFACAPGPPREQIPPLSREPISPQTLYTHASFLASDSLYGRAAGSVHELQAAEYIRREFTNYGLDAAVPGYFQPFNFVERVDLGPGNILSWMSGSSTDREKLLPDKDFRPLGYSSSGSSTGALVFAGYGISSTDPGYDDYAGLDVNGKVVMILRYSLDGTDLNGPYAAHTPLRKKVLHAREQGAVAVIIVTGPAEATEDQLMKLRYDRVGGNAGLPVVHVTREAADRLLAADHLLIAELQREINATRMPLSHGLKGVTVSVTTNLIPHEVEAHNVLATLPGTGILKNQWVIVGAHYDHIGMGGPGSGSMVPDTIAVHNGADDNASGTAALLELARYLAANSPGVASRRSIMFQAYSGEERGALGSSHVVEHSPVPLDSVVAMINLDMVGNLQENKLVIGGAGTSSIWKELLASLNGDSLHLISSDEGLGGSDHTSFYVKNIPVLFFFTGEHSRYHRPTDDVEFLNLPAMAQVGQLAARTVADVATRPMPPDFVRVTSGRPTSRGEISVGLGVVPNFTWEGEGMAISGTRGGGPADKAGFQAGDVIIRIADTDVKNIYDYMYALQELKAGVSITVLVQRGEEELELQVVPELRNR
ncbi:M28 family peptidase [Candidatus Neomarinimicrobiota bacterium]